MGFVMGYMISGFLCFFSGLIWVLAGNIPIGMMNVVVGLVFVALSRL